MNGYFTENEDEIIQLILRGEAVCECGALMNLDDDQFVCPNCVKFTTLENMKITVHMSILQMDAYLLILNPTFRQDVQPVEAHIPVACPHVPDLMIEAILGLWYTIIPTKS